MLDEHVFIHHFVWRTLFDHLHVHPTCWNGNAWKFSRGYKYWTKKDRGEKRPLNPCYGCEAALVIFTVHVNPLPPGGRGLPYKSDGGDRQKFWKEPLNYLVLWVWLQFIFTPPLAPKRCQPRSITLGGTPLKGTTIAPLITFIWESPLWGK